LTISNIDGYGLGHYLKFSSFDVLK